MTKIFVLDTNVILADPFSIYTFGNNEVVIPTIVLQEVDRKKRLMDGLGFNARTFSKEIDKLREVGKLHEGVTLRNGGKLYTQSHPEQSIAYSMYEDDSADTKIIAVAEMLRTKNPDKLVTIISRDILARVKSDACNIPAEDYKHDKVINAESDKYKGYKIIDTDSDTINTFYKNREMALDIEFNENEMALFRFGKQSALGIYKNGKIIPFHNYEEYKEIFGVKALNLEQRMALEILLDDNIPLVTISGKSGSGKTLLALATGLHKTLDYPVYNKVSAARPNIQVGKEHGFLAGSLEEKLRPLLQPIYDNLEFLLDCKDSHELEEKMSGYENIIEIQAISYIRGRSIPKQFMIIDEAQNLTQHEVKTILTRVGQNTKIVLTGDPEQIDHPYLDSFNNGLTYAIEKLKEYKLSAHITLKKGERSPLADLCANVL